MWDDYIFLTTDIEGDILPGASAPKHLREGTIYRHPSAQSADRRHTLKVLALDADTGDDLWHKSLGGEVIAAPITYIANNHQQVSIAAGQAIFTFALED